MLSDQIKQAISTETQSVVTHKLSRKTILLKKRNKSLNNRSVPQISQHYTSIDKQSHVPTVTSGPTFPPPSQCGQSNTVSCQTSNTLIQTQQDNPDSPIFLDIPSTDPIWLEIIPPELLIETTIDKLLEDNKEYFHNLLGLYLHERMQNEFNMSKLVLPKKWSTQYDREFLNKFKQKANTANNFDIKIYDDPKSNASSKFNTTSYKSQFKAYDSSDFGSPLAKRTYEKNPISMATLTSYQANYFDYKNNKPEGYKSQAKLSTGNLPMLSYTTYGQYFKPINDCERYENQRNSYSKLNPIQSSNIFFGKEPQLYEYQTPIQPQVQECYSPTPSYSGQFKSTFKNDFNMHDSPSHGNKNWRHNVVSKLNMMRVKQ